MSVGPFYYKIYRYVEPELAVDREHPPVSIIFPDSLTRALPKSATILDGEKINQTWYDSWDDTNGFQDPIVKVDYVYNRDVDGYLESVTKTVSWGLEDDTYSPLTQVDIIPATNNTEKQAEIRQRRANVVSEVKGLAIDIGLAQGIKDIYGTYALEVGKYVESGLPDLKDAITADTTYTWLDNNTVSPPIIPIRTFLVAKFSVGLE